MNFWRQAGLSYLRYLNYSSKVVRAAVRPAVQEEKKIASRDTTTAMWRKWTDGKKDASGTVIICLACSSATSILAIATHGRTLDVGMEKESLWTVKSQFSPVFELKSAIDLRGYTRQLACYS